MLRGIDLPKPIHPAPRQFPGNEERSPRLPRTKPSIESTSGQNSPRDPQWPLVDSAGALAHAYGLFSGHPRSGLSLGNVLDGLREGVVSPLKGNEEGFA
jgi:hypothetical protein